MLRLRGMIGGVFQVAVIATLLLAPAALLTQNAFGWTRALILLGVWLLVVEIAMIVMAVKAPANLQARLGAASGKRERQPITDTIITHMLVVYLLLWIVFIPIDVFYLRVFEPPSDAVSFAGGVAFVAGYALCFVAIYQNQFAVPIVTRQEEQSVVDRGLYAFVRHPLYTAMLLMFSGMALWLQSWAAFAGVFGLLVMLTMRILIEEATLRQSLPGYRDYCRRVRARLLPLIL